MQAIILATRKATRLLPLTKEKAQCLLKIKDKTILELQVENLKKAGIDDISVITGYLSNEVETFCKELGIKTIFNPFYEVSGMALSLWVTKEKFKGGFIFLYSDILFDSEIIRDSIKNKADICLCIKKDGLRWEAEKVIEKEGIIKKLSKTRTGKENGEFIGIAKFSGAGTEKLIKELDNIAKVNLNASFIEAIDNIIDTGGIVEAHNIENAKFIDIDFPEDLERAKKLFI
ncbi:MAG: phosphocholine cytidylyltransferase family protein [Candidatus Woesearchaeota archaeon]